MLESLTIRNYALITQLTVDFASGFTILTGETGAGKSILIGALGLLLGDKADTSKIRTGCTEASVSGVITVENPELLRWLEDNEIFLDEGALIIRRSIKSAGRGSITIQNEPVNLKVLKELSNFLFDLHGQHEHQSLLATATQRRLLDRYGDLENEVLSFSTLFKEYIETKNLLESKKGNERERARERDMLLYAIDEIETMHIREGEDEVLENESRILSQAERLLSSVELIKGRLNLEDGALSQIIESSRELMGAAEIDEALEPFSSRLDSLRYELEDIFEEVRSYSEHIVFSPQRLDDLQERLTEIRKLKKKYGDSIKEIETYRDDSGIRLHEIDNYDDDMQALQDKVTQLSKAIVSSARTLTTKRMETSTRLEPLIHEHLAKLGMPSSRFTIQITQKIGESGVPTCTANGADTIEFLISANLGEDQKPLRQAASGGELSRIMLALKTVFSESELIETLVFDEIDAGIGGTIAVAVGEHLAELSKRRQILCISHLASVAAKAHKHIIVEKQESSGRTETSITEIVGEKRIAELARMLSGSQTEATALEHARILMGS